MDLRAPPLSRGRRNAHRRRPDHRDSPPAPGRHSSRRTSSPTRAAHGERLRNLLRLGCRATLVSASRPGGIRPSPDGHDHGAQPSGPPPRHARHCRRSGSHRARLSERCGPQLCNLLLRSSKARHARAKSWRMPRTATGTWLAPDRFVTEPDNQISDSQQEKRKICDCH